MGKVCFKCGDEKDTSLFYKHNRMADGYLGKCKECTKQDSTQHRNDNIEKVLEYDRNRKNAEERADQHNERQRIKKQTDPESYAQKKKETSFKYYQKDIDKSRARVKTRRAVLAGNLQKLQECEDCGKFGYTEAHHADYSKHLNVKWLCDYCHKKEHKDIRIFYRTLKKFLAE